MNTTKPTKATLIACSMSGVLALAVSAKGASFDCGKAGTKVEHIICDNPEISNLDDELSVAYKTALKDGKQTDPIAQTQKQWMKERNACMDAVCVRDSYVKRNEQLRAATDTSAESTELATTETPDKPGYFRLDKSNDDGVCKSLRRIINADIKKYGEPRLDEHDEFVKWRDVDEVEIERGTERRYGGRVERADVDINNDGVIDGIIRTGWAMASVELDSLHVRPQNETKKIVIAELLKDDTRNISFIDSKYWRDRYHNKYDDPYLLKADWYFDTGVSIELVRLHGATYLVAQEFAALPRAIAGNILLKDYVAPPDASAKIFVFQIDREYRKYEEKDVCMFVRTCPCGGCKDVRGTTEEIRALPAKKWCNQ